MQTAAASELAGAEIAAECILLLFLIGAFLRFGSVIQTIFTV
jgi:hypothetical protein